VQLTGSPIATCADEFEKQLREVAWSIVWRVLADEIARRRSSKRSNASGARSRQLTLPLVEAARASAPTTTMPQSSPSTASQELGLPEPPSAGVSAERIDVTPAIQASNGRRRWTRDRVVDELADWLLAMPGLDAASVARRGGGTLVQAARREFGRFEAAIAAASVALARRFPDGVPKPGARA
jgi:hypothetical protein